MSRGGEEGMHHARQPATGRLLHRMMSLSDGVFAIVLTLLVLDLRLPPGFSDATLFSGLIAITPKLVAFLTSFAIVGVFWAAHASVMRRLLAFDWPTAWVNLVFLVIHRGDGRLIGGIQRREFWHRWVRSVAPMIGFMIVLAASLLGLRHTSFYLSWILIPAILLLARLLLGPASREAAC
jgi:hypothetical protein